MKTAHARFELKAGIRNGRRAIGAAPNPCLN